jgi:hypothetical protein
LFFFVFACSHHYDGEYEPCVCRITPLKTAIFGSR